MVGDHGSVRSHRNGRHADLDGNLAIRGDWSLPLKAPLVLDEIPFGHVEKDVDGVHADDRREQCGLVLPDEVSLRD